MTLRRLIYLVLLLLCAGVALSDSNVDPSQPAVANPTTPTLSLTAPAAPQSGSDPIDVQVTIAAATNLAAFEFDLVYDPALLLVAGITLGDFLDGTSSCDPADGRCAVALGPQAQSASAVSLGAYSYGNGPGVNGDRVLATIHLQPTGASGTAVLSLTNPLLADTGAFPTVPATRGTTLILGPPATLHLPVVFGESDGLPFPVSRSFIPFVVNAAPGSRRVPSTPGNNPSSQTVPYPAQAPVQQLTSLPAAHLVSAQHSAAGPTRPALDPSSAGGMNPDVNGDGQTNVVDIQRVAKCWNQTPAAPGCEIALDLNNDGTIDLNDVELVAHRWHQAPTTLLHSSPAAGESGVAVTRESVLTFSRPLDPAPISGDAFFARFAGELLPARLHVSPAGEKVTLFYDSILPDSARVRVTVAGETLVDAEGYALDVDGDGFVGGEARIDFDTLSLTTLPGTVVCGTVFASELVQFPVSRYQVFKPVRGKLPEYFASRKHHANLWREILDMSGGSGVDVPLEGVTITVDGRETDLNATTDANGEFCLDPAPAGRFFVHVDGRTASNGVPAGAYYPFVGKAWESKAGQTVDIGNVYLPLVVPDTLQPVSQTADTTIHFPPSVIAEHPEFADVAITVPADSLYADDGTRGGMVGIAPVPPDRLPGPLPPGLNFPIVITVQTDGATNFDEPVPACFPNLPDPDTGEPLPGSSRSALISFNHDTGRFEVVGSMTVTEDGQLVCTDPGVGIPAPGWHGTQPSVRVRGGQIRQEPPELQFASEETDWNFLPAFEDKSGETIAPLNRFRFLAGLTRTIRIRSIPGGTVFIDPIGNSPPADPATGILDGNGEFEFTPDANEQNRPATHTGPLKPIKYFVTVLGSTGEVEFDIIGQDLIDRIRQEYVDSTIQYGADFTSGSVGLDNGAPPRDQIIVAPSPDIGGLRNADRPNPNCRDGPNPNYYDPEPGIGIGMIWDQGFAALVQTLQTAMGPDGLCLHSGHRSPSHNRRVGGVRNSDHQWGRAADMSHEGTVIGTISANFHLRLYRAALDATSGQVLLERGATQLLPDRWDPPPATHTFQVGNGWSVTVEDSNGDGLPNIVSQVVPTDTIPSNTQLNWNGGGSSNPSFRIDDSTNDGFISVGESLFLLHNGQLILDDIFPYPNATHVHAEAASTTSSSELAIKFINKNKQALVVPTKAGRSSQQTIQGTVLEQGLHYFAVEDLETGNVLLRGIAGSNGIAHDSLILAPNTTYRHYILQAETLTVGYIGYTTPAGGSSFDLLPFYLYSSTSSDTDNDGLTEDAELVLGTSSDNPDTDGDGVNDGPEVQQGTDPLDGLPAATGIIATADTPGTAVDICAVNDIAIVADSEAGVSVFSAVNGRNPITIARVDTPGSAQAVACAGNLVAIADGEAGLAVIDISDPPAAEIIHQVTLEGVVQAVEAGGNIAYVGLSPARLVAIDLVSGTVLGEVTFSGEVEDVAIQGDYVYFVTQDKLFTASLLQGQFDIVDSTTIPTIGATLPERHLFVGGEIAYGGHNAGYNTFSLADPAQPVLIAAGQTGQRGWQQIVDNGSGLGVAVVGISPFSERNLFLYDVSDPAETDRFLTSFDTPGDAQAVSIYNGLAYVADGEAGLQVVNYLAYDSLGVPPTLSLSTNFAAGQAEEGQVMRVTAAVDDDVQVRNVEFYVDGARTAVDGNFPFEHRFVTPLLSQQPAFTLQARATDTGGNATWTEVMTLTLTADATSPAVSRVAPSDGAVKATGSVQTISAVFSEPIDLATLDDGAFQLFAAGSDGTPGTGDDVLITGGVVAYRSEINAALLSFSSALPPDQYQARLKATLSDLAGNPLPADVVWAFSLKEPVYWIADADGFWHDAGSWSTGAVPGADDIVIVDRPAGDFTLTYNCACSSSIYSLHSEEAIVLDGGSFGFLTIASDSEINNTAGLLSGWLTNNGNLIIDDMFTWTGGTLSGSGRTIAKGGIAINGSQDKFLSGHTLDNLSTATWSGTGHIWASGGGGGVLNNLPGATFEVQADANFIGANGRFNNAGTFVKSAGGGTTRIDSIFENTGVVDAQSGTLRLRGDGFSNNVLMATGGGILNIDSNNYDLTPGSVVSGTGTIDFSGTSVNVSGTYSVSGSTRFSGGTANFNNAVITSVGNSLTVSGGTVNFGLGNPITTPTLVLSGGTLTSENDITVSDVISWTGGTMRGPAATIANGSLEISSPPGSGARILDARTLINNGTATWAGTGSLNLNNGAVLNNLGGATFDIQGDPNLGGSGGTFDNEGLLTKSADGTTVILGSINFRNSGSVEVLSGTVSFTSDYVQTAGTTVLNGGSLATSNTSVLDIQGGSLTGAGVIDGNVSNAGEIYPGGIGASGILTITQEYVQAVTGTLYIELGGLTAGTEHDQLVVGDTATLTGTLDVDLISGFDPTGSNFTVFTYSTHAGAFATINGNGRTYLPSYNANDLTLTAP